MPKKDSNTQAKIVKAAWNLFYSQGYENTTVEEIVDESGTSRGSFYHYFKGKDELLNTLAELFDNKYSELRPTLAGKKTAYEKLIYLNRELFLMVEDSVSMDLLARMYSSQLVSGSARNLLDRNRIYYKLLREIVTEGAANGEFDPALTVNDIVMAYAMIERALISDWCLSNGEYSLVRRSGETLPRLLKGYLNPSSN
jgi:AcrR family transcriptional regulator